MSLHVFPVHTYAVAIRDLVASVLPAEAEGRILMSPARLLEQPRALAYTVIPATPTARYQPSLELGPETTQTESWAWYVYLTVGVPDDEAALALAGELLPPVISALVGWSPEPGVAGALERGEVGYYGFVPNGHIFGARLTHDRWTGETP
jgi:hypothetical protein